MGAAFAIMVQMVASGSSDAPIEEDGGGVELYDENDNIEYTYEERMKLKGALITQADVDFPGFPRHWLTPKNTPLRT